MVQYYVQYACRTVRTVTSSLRNVMMSSHVIVLLHVELHQFTIKGVCDRKVKIPLGIHVCRHGEGKREREKEQEREINTFKDTTNSR